LQSLRYIDFLEPLNFLIFKLFERAVFKDYKLLLPFFLQFFSTFKVFEELFLLNFLIAFLTSVLEIFYFLVFDHFKALA
jgi:hypothetical protein